MTPFEKTTQEENDSGMYMLGSEVQALIEAFRMVDEALGFKPVKNRSCLDCFWFHECGSSLGAAEDCQEFEKWEPNSKCYSCGKTATCQQEAHECGEQL